MHEDSNRSSTALGVFSGCTSCEEADLQDVVITLKGLAVGVAAPREAPEEQQAEGEDVHAPSLLRHAATLLQQLLGGLPPTAAACANSARLKGTRQQSCLPRATPSILQSCSREQAPERQQRALSCLLVACSFPSCYSACVHVVLQNSTRELSSGASQAVHRLVLTDGGALNKALVAHDALGQAHVGDARCELLGRQHILGLEIAVNDSLGVQCLKALPNLPSNLLEQSTVK